MIYDKIANGGRYLGISSYLDKALWFMMDTDLASLEDGRHEIDGDNVFVNVMCANTKADKKEYEFHEKYYDIQIDLEGAEDVLFSTAFEEITIPYEESGDIGRGTAVCEVCCHLTPGRFVICEPQEPHLPVLAVQGREEPVRKAVFKVRKQG